MAMEGEMSVYVCVGFRLCVVSSSVFLFVRICACVRFRLDMMSLSGCL